MNDPIMPRPDPKELRDAIERMRAVNTAFYRGAVNAQVHAFIEFCGMQSKFIDMCQRALDSGQDFMGINKHSGETWDVYEHDIRYLAEKFSCIYGPVFKGREELKQLFIKEALSE